MKLVNEESRSIRIVNTEERRKAKDVLIVVWDSLQHLFRFLIFWTQVQLQPRGLGLFIAAFLFFFFGLNSNYSCGVWDSL